MLYQDLVAKRKKALVAVCTLGLSDAPWRFLFSNARDADKGMSFQGGVVGFIFRAVWFIVWTLLSCMVLWVVNILRLIYYSIKLSNYK